jgi:hypothetical protein
MAVARVDDGEDLVVAATPFGIWLQAARNSAKQVGAKSGHLSLDLRQIGTEVASNA